MISKKRKMVKLKYRKCDYVSNQSVYNVLWCGADLDFTDISCQKPIINPLKIN